MTHRATTTCAYCSNPIPDGAATCPTCSAPAPPPRAQAAMPAAGPTPQVVVVAPGVPQPVAAPQRWPGQPRPAGSGFGGAQQSFQAPPPPVQVYLTQPRPRGSRVGIVAIMVLVALFGTGIAVYMSLANAPGGIGLVSADPQPIQLNQVVQGELTTFRTRSLYQLTIAQPTQVMISASSTWDNYLELQTSSSGQPLYQDDDSGGSRNALINAMLSPGVYTIVVRPFSSATGPFTLNVTGFSATPMPVAPYQYPAVPMPPQGYPQYSPTMPIQ